MIVVGTHGRTGVARVLMGSTAEGLLRESPCQVLVVKPHVASTKDTLRLDAPDNRFALMRPPLSSSTEAEIRRTRDHRLQPAQS